MHRTQIYVTAEQHARLRELAEDRGVPRAVVIREILDAALETVDAGREDAAVLRRTAGALKDAPSWEKWLDSVRGGPASHRLDELGL